MGARINRATRALRAWLWVCLLLAIASIPAHAGPQDSVMRVEGVSSFATAFVIARNQIVTNAHVCLDNALVPLLSVIHRGRRYTVIPIKLNPAVDLCLLEGSLPYIPPLKINSRPVTPGEFLASHTWTGRKTGVAIDRDSYGGNYPYGPSACACGGGEHEGWGCNILPPTFTTTIHTVGGDSGSPVVDKAGRVRGVMYINDEKNQGSMVSAAALASFLSDPRIEQCVKIKTGQKSSKE